MSFYFGDKTWVELDAEIKKGAVVILPIGTTEEHGRHLAVSTDAKIARCFGDEFGKALCGEIPVLVTETIHYGFSMAIVRRWPGCPNIGTRHFMDYIYDMVSSLIKMGFEKVVLLDCHGNHDGLLRTVMREIADDLGKFIMILSPFKLSQKRYNELKKDPAGDIHGGEWETSLMLAIDPNLVHPEEYTCVDAVRCNDSPLLGPVSTWGLQETKTGLFGDPTAATAQLGREIIIAAVAEGARYIREFYSYGK